MVFASGIKEAGDCIGDGIGEDWVISGKVNAFDRIGYLGIRIEIGYGSASGIMGGIYSPNQGIGQISGRG